MGRTDLTTLEGAAFTGGVTGRTRSGNSRPIQSLAPDPSSPSTCNTKALNICSWDSDGIGQGKPEALLASIDNPTQAAHVVALLETGGSVPTNVMFGYSTCEEWKQFHDRRCRG